MMMVNRRRSEIPGTKFNPTNLELVNNYLRRRIERNKRSRYITDMDVYEKVPWLLEHVTHPKFNKNEWFYFVRRKKLAGVKKSDSKRTSRTVGSGGDFTWKSNVSTSIFDKDGPPEVGSMQHLSLVLKVKGKTEKTTGWVMHEFLLDKPGFQEVVLCKIMFHPGNDNAQYAPRLETRVIEPPREEHQDLGSCGHYSLGARQQINENHLHMLKDGLASTTNQSIMEDPYFGQGYEKVVDYLNQTDPSQVPMMNQALDALVVNQWIGSCSGETVSYSTAQNQQIMGQYSNCPMNGVMEQQQDFTSNYGQSFGDDMAHHEYQKQETDPSQFPISQGMMGHQQEQYLVSQPMNVSMEQHQDHFGSCSHDFMGDFTPMDEQFWEQVMKHPYSADQVSPYPFQPYHQHDTTQSYSQVDFSQNHQYSGHNTLNDFSYGAATTKLSLF